MKKILWILASDEKYHQLKEVAIKSLKKFSRHRIVNFHINYEPSEKGLADEEIEITLSSDRNKSKWFWKNSICLRSIELFPEHELVWIDCDIIAKSNIDSIFNTELENFPLFDKCLREQYIGSYKDINENRTQLYNERLYKDLNITRRNRHLAHACLFRFDERHKEFFREAESIYHSMTEEEAEVYLPWNDESIYNLLLEKANYDNYLDFTCFDIDTYGDNNTDSFVFFQEFLWRTGPNNFSDPWGWRFIPEDKNTIVYFHGCKNTEHAELILYLIANENFVWWSEQGIHDFSSIYGKEGSTLQIAESYGWPAAVFHEIYNLKDYEQFFDLPKNGTVVDLGANIGIFTRRAEEKGNRVIAFEANPEYYECLKRNVKTKELYNCIISDKSSINQSTLWTTSHFGGATVYECEGIPVNVESYCLNDLFETGLFEEIDFIKIDIEGSERQVLDSLSDLNAKKIKKYAIEWHNKVANRNVDNVEEKDIDKKLSETAERFYNLGFNTHVVTLGNDNALRMFYIWK